MTEEHRNTESDDVSKKARSGVLWNVIGSSSRQLMLLVTTSILARLLTPEDFGVIGIAMVVLGVLRVITDVGFTPALIQKKDLKSSTINSVYIFNLFMSGILGVLLYVLAGPISIFFDQVLLAPVLKILAFIPIIRALTSVNFALLTKELSFKKIFFIEQTGMLAGLITGVVGAFLGYGVFALAYQQILSAVFLSLGLFFFTKWKPSFYFSFSSLKSVLSFSFYVFIDKVAQVLTRRIDTLFIGKFFSVSDLGHYSRSRSLVGQMTTLSNTVVMKTMFPVFSRIQDDKERVGKILNQLINTILFIGMVLLIAILYNTDIVILGLFGPQWTQSILYFNYLVLMIPLMPVGTLLSQVLLSTGDAKLKFRIGVIAKVLVLIPLLIGYFFGMIPMIFGMIVARLVIVSMSFFFVNRKIECDWQRIVKMGMFYFIVVLGVVVVKVLFTPTIWLRIIVPLIGLILLVTVQMNSKYDSVKFIRKQVKEMFKRNIV